jgi:hypothetical protein
MTPLARTLCTLFAVALLAVMNLHGVTQSQHAMAHAADWPPVALVEAPDDHDHIGAHIHVAPEDAPQSDDDRDGDGDRPVGHHHHGGGDGQAAIPVSSRALTETPRLVSTVVGPDTGPPLTGLTGDGPDYPPKRMRTIV